MTRLITRLNTLQRRWRHLEWARNGRLQVLSPGLTPNMTVLLPMMVFKKYQLRSSIKV